MSRKRLRGEGPLNVYHCILKAPDRTPGNHEFAFGEAEKLKMELLVRELQEKFLVEVICYCHMSTHSHLIVAQRRDALEKLGREGLRQRYREYLIAKGVSPKACANIDLRTRDAQKFARRINDVSSFCGLLEQLFAQWYNAKHQHRGNVFTPRYKSVLLTSLKAVVRCAQYIELNPVRAHMTHWAKDYTHNSYHLIRSGGRQAEEQKEKLLTVLRHFGNLQNQNWSDERLLQLYKKELESITDLPGGSDEAENQQLLLSGHNYFSGNGGVLSVGGNMNTLELRTSSDIKEFSWDQFN